MTSITVSATLCHLVSPTARRGGLRGARGISTDSHIAANLDRGFCPKKRSAAVVPSGRVSRKLCTAVRHARFLGWSSPHNAWFRNEKYPLRPSTLELERQRTLATFTARQINTVVRVADGPHALANLLPRLVEALGVAVLVKPCGASAPIPSPLVISIAPLCVMDYSTHSYLLPKLIPCHVRSGWRRMVR